MQKWAPGGRRSERQRPPEKTSCEEDLKDATTRTMHDGRELRVGTKIQVPACIVGGLKSKCPQKASLGGQALSQNTC